jgi:hypothetical protein
MASALRQPSRRARSFSVAFNARHFWQTSRERGIAAYSRGLQSGQCSESQNRLIHKGFRELGSVQIWTKLDRVNLLKSLSKTRFLRF